jgi:hypothetical protein
MKPPGSILENHDTMFVCVVTAELQLFLGAALKVTAYTCPQFSILLVLQSIIWLANS